MSAAELEQAMLQLDRQDLVTLIRRGIQALEESKTADAQAEIAEAWDTELRRRIDEVESGQAELLTVAQVDARVDELLEQLRS